LRVELVSRSLCPLWHDDCLEWPELAYQCVATQFGEPVRVTLKTKEPGRGRLTYVSRLRSKWFKRRKTADVVKVLKEEGRIPLDTEIVETAT
jgi:hypothetical protein